MDLHAYDRWLEVSFYYFCMDLIAKGYSPQDIANLMQGLAAFGNYTSLPCPSIVQDTLLTYRLQPNREELLLLMYHNKIPIRQISREMKISNDKIYAVIQKDKENPRTFYPRIHTSKIAIIKKFLDTIEILKKAGVHKL